MELKMASFTFDEDGFVKPFIYQGSPDLINLYWKEYVQAAISIYEDIYYVEFDICSSLDDAKALFTYLTLIFNPNFVKGDFIAESVLVLPDNLTVIGNLDLSWSDMTSLPKNLTIRGDLDISETQMTINSLPSCANISGNVTWGISERAAFDYISPYEYPTVMRYYTKVDIHPIWVY